MDKTYSVTYLSSFTSGTSGASARACTCMHMCTHSNDFENKKDLLFFSFFFFSIIIYVQDTGYMGSRQANTEHVPKKANKKKQTKIKHYKEVYVYYLG